MVAPESKLAGWRQLVLSLAVHMAWLALALFMTAPAMGQGGGGQGGADTQTLAGMWQHGLTDAAMRYAESRRRVSGDDGDEQARWLILLMECHAQAGLRDTPIQAPPSRSSTLPASEGHWGIAQQLLDDFAAEQDQHPRLPWARWQGGRCRLLRAQASLAKHLAAPGNQAVREETLALVRSVLVATERLSDDLRQRIPLAAREGFRNDQHAPVQELHRLAVDVALLECEALLVRMRMYPPGSADSVAAAAEIDKRAQAVLDRSGQDVATTDPVAVARAMAQLELGPRDQALLALERLAREGATEQVRRRAAVVAVEQLASDGQISRATPLLSILEGLSASAGGSPEAELARLQLSLAELDRTAKSSRDPAIKDPSNREKRIAQLAKDAQSLGERFGEYWRNRAEALLVAGGGSPGAPAAATPELMLAEVRQLLASGDSERAIVRLLEFRDAEAAAGRGQSAVQLATQAAALLQRQQAWAESIAAAQDVSLQFPTVTGSPAAHRLAVWAQAQLLRQASTPDRKLVYETAMKRHLQRWPDASDSDQVQQWLTSWLVGSGRRIELVETLADRGLAATEDRVRAQTMLDWLEQVVALKPSLGSNNAVANQGVTSQDPAGDVALPVVSPLASLEAALQEQGRQGEPLFQAVILLTRVLAEWPTKPQAEILNRQLSALRRSAFVEGNERREVEKQRIAPESPISTPAIASPPAITSALLARVAWQASAAIAALRAEDKDWLRSAGGPAEWQSFAWPPSVRSSLALALLEALDEFPAGEQSAWQQRLLASRVSVASDPLQPAWNEAWGKELAARPTAVEQAAGLRMLAWGKDAAAVEAAAKQVVELVDRFPQVGPLRLQLAQLHAGRGASGLEESDRLARFIVANTPAGSDLNLAARWRLCKNRLQAGDRDAARDMARLLIASQPLPPSIWLERFERLEGR